MIQITTLKWVPEFVQGYVKDLPVRWALEEINEPYQLQLITRGDQQSAAYRKEQPFGQVPVLTDGDLHLFECGSILLHIGEKSEKLLPKDPQARARARTWVFAALNSLEPYIQFYNNFMQGSNDQQKNNIEMLVTKRLEAMESWIGDKEFLEDQFTVGDIMMTIILRLVSESDLMQGCPRLKAYSNRCMARPAFKKALQDQLKTFADNAPS